MTRLEMARPLCLVCPCGEALSPGRGKGSDWAMAKPGAVEKAWH